MNLVRSKNSLLLILGISVAAASCGGRLSAQDTVDDEQEAADKGPEAVGEEKKTAEPDAGKKSDLIRLDKDSKVWIDLSRKIVIVEGEVCLREGQLEMFACPRSTKNHESVVSVESKAYVIHAALAVGAQVGRPVQFAPEYVPASGTEVDVVVLWVDKGKRRKARAQEWIRQVKTGKPMPYTWVFAGSGFWVDDETGQKHYMAEDGDLICVSNFATATLDLPVLSSQSNDGLMFDAFTENIPELGTKVRLILIPKLKKGGAEGDEEGADKPEDDRGDAAETPASGTTE